MDNTLVDKTKLFIAAIITVIVLAAMYISACILSQPPGLIVTICVFFSIGIIVFPLSYILMHRGVMGLYNKPTNATLTCKNGHECRVWVSYSGRGWWFDLEKGGEAYHIGGMPAIIPDTCPECGARWKVPHKHKEHNKN